MPDNTSKIENVLRRAIAEKGADTAGAREVIYNVARRTLERSLADRAGRDDASRPRALREGLEFAIFSIENDLEGVTGLESLAPPLLHQKDSYSMSDTTPTSHRDPMPRKTPSRVLPLAVVIALAAVAAGAWFVMDGNAQSDSTASVSMEGLETDSLSETTSKLSLDPEIVGYVDTLAIEDGVITFSGWAGDKSDPEQPVSLVAYAEDKTLAVTKGSGVRNDVTAFPKGSEVAFQFETKNPCPSGDKMTVLAVSDDGRYAPVQFWKLDAVCP